MKMNLSLAVLLGLQEAADPKFQALGKLAFDPNQIASMSSYAVPYSVEWMMYFIGEARDASGNFLGYSVQYNGGLMAGCLAQ